LSFHVVRLLDIIHDENRLYLVFEFLDLDLKKYMDTLPTTTITGLPLDQVKVLLATGHTLRAKKSKQQKDDICPMSSTLLTPTNKQKKHH
jgi:hypothetical protein